MSIAFVFPGQGSQAIGMGRDLYEESPAARAIFDMADAALGFPITQLCFEGPEEALLSTENTQPALLATSTALLAMLADDDAGFPSFVRRQAGFVAGHSLGEYSAAVATGALDVQTALRLVRRRGELMAAANEGMMAAIIGMDEEPLLAICADVGTEDQPVVIANYNAPGQLVISGAIDAVRRAMELARERGALYALSIKVSAAFHSPLMRDSAEQLATVLRRAVISDAGVPIVSNVTTELLTDAEAIRAEFIAQMTAPVQWIALVRRMVHEGVDTFVEVGPGTLLTQGMIKRIAPRTTLISVCDAESVRAFRAWLQERSARTDRSA